MMERKRRNLVVASHIGPDIMVPLSQNSNSTAQREWNTNADSLRIIAYRTVTVREFILELHDVTKWL